jgi:hypothetical protein
MMKVNIHDYPVDFVIVTLIIPAFIDLSARQALTSLGWTIYIEH